MSVYDTWLEVPIQANYEAQEHAQAWMENKVRALEADDDILLEALGDSLADPYTRLQIVHSIRSGDLLNAITVMCGHVPIYINEAAEVAYAKENGL